MNKTNIPGPDPDNLLKRILKDDLPPEAEARMKRRFLNFRNALERSEGPAGADARTWMHGLFRKEILALASALMLIGGAVMHLGGSQSVLAHSIEQLKVIVSISAGLDRASFMDCTVLKQGPEDEGSSYRVRWRAAGDVRVDMDSAGGLQTLWISDETISIAGPDDDNVRSMSIQTMTPGPVWQPAMEFLSPKILSGRLEEQYGLMQSGGRSGFGTDEFLITGREGRRDVEITVDAKTYLPKALKKYVQDSSLKSGERDCLMEVRFYWNRTLPGELFVPGPLQGKQ